MAILWVLAPSYSQNGSPGTEEGVDQKIWFSTIPVERQESLQPYYEALKNAEYGVPRFSILEQLAERHIETANTDSILFYSNQYIKELTNWDEPESARKNYYAKAYYYKAIGNKFNGLLDNAVEWHIRGITEAEASNNKEYQFRNKIGLGKVYELKQEFDKAIPILEEAYADFGSSFPRQANEALRYLGDAHYSSNDLEKAKTFYEQSKKGSTALGDTGKELSVNLKLGRIAERENRFDEAFALYNTARESGLKEGLFALYFEGCIRIGDLFFREKNYEAATTALSIAYVNAIDRENLNYQAEILDIQRRAFSAQGDYKNAYAVMTQLASVRSQIAQQQQRKISRELEVQYETLQKEKEILSLEEDQLKKTAELNRQKTIKNAFLIGFLVILIPVIALLYTYYQKLQAQSELAMKQEEINRQKVESLKQEQELDLIKAAIEGQDEERKRIAQELHDSIGGNLAGIKLQLASIDQDTEQLGLIGKHLDETYQLVRDISHTLIPKKFRNNVFTQLIREYVKSIANTGSMTIGFHPHPEDKVNGIDEKIQLELFKIIQELLTNTLKHAEAKKIDIHLSHLDTSISLLFEDNGKGFELSKKQDGIGFKNIKSRISEMKGQLHIDSAPKRGTVVAIEMPISKKLEE
ncbi:histidine kinase [Flavobacteriaceae bacterium TP-CH-4]|uniref:Histidine kinase n=1 Tax=Pelagihabitans pacificus TaxID=2696054 RepID=A0A967AXA8_9FLAO|nr:sensor histidine kinase [Pelagihabitans pacificus]NHF60868.1 histidine kinase [Pelagihabitans pacificus]